MTTDNTMDTTAETGVSRRALLKTGAVTLAWNAEDAIVLGRADA